VVASTLEEGREKSIAKKVAVNSPSYRGFHSAQMFEQGLSFSGFERNKVWISSGGRFVDLSDVSGADNPNDSRAAVMADFDDDGDVDLFVHNIQRERHNLYRNDALAPGEHGFLKLVLRATRSQHEAIGATVIVQGPAGRQARVLARGDGFLSCAAPELVFGLGKAAEAEVEVLWPGGVRESFGKLPAGTRALLVEGSGRAEPVLARPRALPDPLPPGLRLSEGDLLPPLLLADEDGRPARFDPRAVADGKPLLVNFWASYCGPCVAELPLLSRRHVEGSLRVVSISLDVAADLPTARAQLERQEAHFPAYFLAGAPAESSADARVLGEILDLERFSLPTSLVLSPEGRIDGILRGPIESTR
jgi:thiol-disulfide isomerase/thioredoxin